MNDAAVLIDRLITASAFALGAVSIAALVCVFHSAYRSNSLPTKLEILMVVALGAPSGFVMTRAIINGYDKMTNQPEQTPPAAVEPAEPTESGFAGWAKDFPRDSLGGRYEGDGLSVSWRGTGDEGANVSNVVAASIRRLEFEQSRDELASNDKAQAMVLLMQARAVLEGHETKADDGIPIIE